MKELKKKSLGYEGIEITDFVENRAYGYESEHGCDCTWACSISVFPCDGDEWIQQGNWDFALTRSYEPEYLYH